MQGLICSIALANGRHEHPVASDFYVRKFLERHPELIEIKTSKLGHHRAKQANAEVRDAVFAKLGTVNTLHYHYPLSQGL